MPTIPIDIIFLPYWKTGWQELVRLAATEALRTNPGEHSTTSLLRLLGFDRALDPKAAGAANTKLNMLKTGGALAGLWSNHPTRKSPFKDENGQRRPSIVWEYTDAAAKAPASLIQPVSPPVVIPEPARPATAAMLALQAEAGEDKLLAAWLSGLVIRYQFEGDDEETTLAKMRDRLKQAEKLLDI